MLAQYTENKGISLGRIFDNIKVNVDSYKEIIDAFKSIESFDDFIDPNGKANWDTIAKAIEGCDETALSYFKTLDDGNGTINNQSASIEGLGAHLKATGQSFNFAAIKATLLYRKILYKYYFLNDIYRVFLLKNFLTFCLTYSTLELL